VNGKGRSFDRYAPQDDKIKGVNGERSTVNGKGKNKALALPASGIPSPDASLLALACHSEDHRDEESGLDPDLRLWAKGAERPPSGGFRFASLRMTGEIKCVNRKRNYATVCAW